jgi:hypothetical protein
MKMIAKSIMLVSGLLLAGTADAMVQRAKDYDMAIAKAISKATAAKQSVAPATLAPLSAAEKEKRIKLAAAQGAEANKAMVDANGFLTDVALWVEKGVETSSRTPDINERNAVERAMGSKPAAWVAKKKAEQIAAMTKLGGAGNLASTIANLGSRPTFVATTATGKAHADLATCEDDFTKCLFDKQVAVDALAAANEDIKTYKDVLLIIKTEGDDALAATTIDAALHDRLIGAIQDLIDGGKL